MDGLMPGDLEALQAFSGVEHHRAGDLGTRSILGLHDEVQALPQTRIHGVCEPGDCGFVIGFVVKKKRTEFVKILWQSGKTYLFKRAGWMDSFKRYREAPLVDQEVSGHIRCQVYNAFDGTRRALVPDFYVDGGILGLELMLRVAGGMGRRVEELSLLINGSPRPLEEGDVPLAGHTSDVIIQVFQRQPREAEWLDSDNWFSRVSAVHTIGARNDVARFIPQLVPLLQDAEPRVQIATLKALANAALSDDSGDSLRAEWDSISLVISSSLKDRREAVRMCAIKILRGVGPTALSHAPSLAEALHDPEAEVRIAAAQALAGLGPTVLPHAPSLAEALHDPEAEVRIAAARALAGLGVAQLFLRQFVALLEDRDRGVRGKAVELLGNLGPAVPQLVSLLQDAEPRVQIAALKALANAALSDGIDDSLRAEWGNISPVINSLLKDQREVVKMCAIKILRGVGPTALPHAPSLAEALYDPEAEVRIAAARALAGLGVAQLFLRQFVTLLEDRDRGVRGEAVEVLGNLGQAALPDLIQYLSHENPKTRCAAARVLRGMGLVAAPAANQLRALLHDSDKWVRDVASLALEAVEGGDVELNKQSATGNDADAGSRRSAVGNRFRTRKETFSPTAGNDADADADAGSRRPASSELNPETCVVQCRELAFDASTRLAGSATLEPGLRTIRRRWGRDRAILAGGSHTQRDELFSPA